MAQDKKPIDIFYEGKIYKDADEEEWRYCEDFRELYLYLCELPTSHPVSGSHTWEDGDNVTGRYELKECDCPVNQCKAIGVAGKFNRCVYAVPLPSAGERFKMPTDKDIIDFALIFNDGNIQDRGKLADMVAMCNFIIDRLYENGDIKIPSSKEKQQ